MSARTVKVRFAAVVDPDGNYSAWDQGSEMHAQLEHGEVVNWIEAELPIPDKPIEREFDATLVERIAHSTPSGD